MLDKKTPVERFLEEQRLTMVKLHPKCRKRNGSHPRKDYKELLQLLLIYFGGWIENNFSFRIPGALRQARWMIKVIYTLYESILLNN